MKCTLPCPLPEAGTTNSRRVPTSVADLPTLLMSGGARPKQPGFTVMTCRDHRSWLVWLALEGARTGCLNGGIM